MQKINCSTWNVIFVMQSMYFWKIRAIFTGKMIHQFHGSIDLIRLRTGSNLPMTERMDREEK